MIRFVAKYFRMRQPLMAATALLIMGVCSNASAQTAETELQDPMMPDVTTAIPAALFQYASIVGAGNSITVSRVPVTTSSGTIVYHDITLTFAATVTGAISLSGSKIVASPTLMIAGFKAGKYIAPSSYWGDSGFISVAGPGVSAGSATQWTLTLPTGANGCTTPSSAAWYTGPIASNPLASRLQAAKITSNAWSYGTGTTSCGWSNWGDDTLLGFSQVANTITIASFTQNGVDHNIPVDQITYTLVP